LLGDYADAKAVAAEADRQILGLYRLYASNYLALEQLQAEYPAVNIEGWRGQFDAATLALEEKRFADRLAACPLDQRPWWLRQYAKPVISRQWVSDQPGSQGQQ